MKSKCSFEFKRTDMLCLKRIVPDNSKTINDLSNEFASLVMLHSTSISEGIKNLEKYAKFYEITCYITNKESLGFFRHFISDRSAPIPMKFLTCLRDMIYWTNIDDHDAMILLEIIFNNVSLFDQLSMQDISYRGIQIPEDLFLTISHPEVFEFAKNWDFIHPLSMYGKMTKDYEHIVKNSAWQYCVCYNLFSCPVDLGTHKNDAIQMAMHDYVSRIPLRREMFLKQGYATPFGSIAVTDTNLIVVIDRSRFDDLPEGMVIGVYSEEKDKRLFYNIDSAIRLSQVSGSHLYGLRSLIKSISAIENWKLE